MPQADRDRNRLAVWQVILGPDPAVIGAWAWSGMSHITRWSAVWEPAWGRIVPVVMGRRGGPEPLDEAPDPGDAAAWRDWLIAAGWVTPDEWHQYTDPRRMREAAIWRPPVVW